MAKKTYKGKVLSPIKRNGKVYKPGKTLTTTDKAAYDRMVKGGSLLNPDAPMEDEKQNSGDGDNTGGSDGGDNTGGGD